MPLEAGLLEILACPACHAPLREEAAREADTADGPDATGATDGPHATGANAAAPGPVTPPAELVCTGGNACGLAYPVRDGIPVLLVDEARRPA